MPGGAHVVAEFTGHAVVLTDRNPDELFALGIDAFGGLTQPAVITWLAGPSGTVGSHDVVLVARGRSERAKRSDGLMLPVRTDLVDHPRVQRANQHRRNVVVHGDDRGFVTLGHGLVDRLEVSVELLDAEAGQGAGRGLINDALNLVADGDLVWAQVAPGNAASVRAFLSAGFVAVGAETLITPW